MLRDLYHQLAGNPTVKLEDVLDVPEDLEMNIKIRSIHRTPEIVLEMELWGKRIASIMPQEWKTAYETAHEGINALNIKSSSYHLTAPIDNKITIPPYQEDTALQLYALTKRLHPATEQYPLARCIKEECGVEFEMGKGGVLIIARADEHYASLLEKILTILKPTRHNLILTKSDFEKVKIQIPSLQEEKTFQRNKDEFSDDIENILTSYALTVTTAQLTSIVDALGKPLPNLKEHFFDDGLEYEVKEVGTIFTHSYIQSHQRTRLGPKTYQTLAEKIAQAFAEHKEPPQISIEPPFIEKYYEKALEYGDNTFIDAVFASTRSGTNIFEDATFCSFINAKDTTGLAYWLCAHLPKRCAERTYCSATLISENNTISSLGPKTELLNVRNSSSRPRHDSPIDYMTDGISYWNGISYWKSSSPTLNLQWSVMSPTMEPVQEDLLKKLGVQIKHPISNTPELRY